MELKIKEENNVNSINQSDSQSESQLQNIIYLKINDYLLLINQARANIFEVSSYICEQYYKNKNFFFQELIPLIFYHCRETKKIEYLYLLIEIIKTLYNNNNKIPKDDLISLYLFMKDLCRNFHFSMNNEFIKAIKDTLNKFKETKIFREDDIHNIIMELRIRTDPKITNSENDKKYLMNLIKDKSLNIDIDMINFHKDLDAVEKRNINRLKLNLIKKENDIIEKQINLYNHNLEQIKNINKLLQVLDKNFPDLK